MQLKDIQSAYFIGIGGIGMSAIVRHFLQHGIRVSGYDRTPTPLTLQLEKEGCLIHFIEDCNLIDKHTDIVVYTPAISTSHAELQYYLSNNYVVQKRSEVLQWITARAFTIAIGGSHGKTSTSTMVAHLLQHTGYGCTAFLGGISTNLNSNYCGSNNDCIVVEADEYDRSFHKLCPDIAIITSIDADHLDIYETHDNVIEAYYQFGQRATDLLITHADTGFQSREFKAQNLTYTISNTKANLYSKIKKIETKSYTFDFYYTEKKIVIEDIIINVSGIHNVENMTAAISVAVHLNIDHKRIRDAVASFSGIKRRFEYIIDTPSVTYIDDYAHHPTEVRNFLLSLRKQYPNRRITAIFQPHLFSRTRDFVAGFAETLSISDQVILLDIYPAREMPISGVTSQIIFDKLICKEKWLITKEEVIMNLHKMKLDVVATIGAGDIDTLVLPIKEFLIQNNHAV